MYFTARLRFSDIILLITLSILFSPMRLESATKSNSESQTISGGSLTWDEASEILKFALANPGILPPPPNSSSVMTPATCCTVPGDANGSGNVTITDATYILAMLRGLASPVCALEADANGDCIVGVEDAEWIINRIFFGGPPPVCGDCDSVIVGGILQDPGDSLVIHLDGGLACDQSNPISVKAHTVSEVSSLTISLKMIHAGTVTVDSLVLGIPDNFFGGVSLSFSSDGISPDTLIFMGIISDPPIPALTGETIFTIWVTPTSADPFEFSEINDIFQKTRYTSPSDPGEFILPLQTEVMSASCAGSLFVNPDPRMVICPGGDAAFRVQVVDELNNPVVGNSSVWIELVNCSNLYSCSNGPGIDTLFPAAPSDTNGFLTFFPEGGGCDAACVANIKLGAATKATVPVLTFDVNGDTLVSVADFAWDPICNDYAGGPGIGIEDFNAWNKHLGHHCDLDPCERFSASFTVTPGFNLFPGRVVTLEVEISNNSFDVCFIGPIGFFNSGFGAGETDVLFDNVIFNDTIHPGEVARVSVEFTIPGTGVGCFSTNFLTQAPCCDTAISLRRCVESTQHCTKDRNICYEQRITLNQFPIDSFMIIDAFLPDPGWQVVAIRTPATPLNTLDTLVYEICTPDLASLGDSAVVPVYVYSQGNPIPEVFETEVFVTSRTGDSNGDCRVNIADITYKISRIFAGGPPPIPPEAGDPNCSGSLNIADITYLIALIFSGGPAPCVK